MLSSIPDRELIARLEELRRAERASCVDILHHLNEIERRSLHLRLGYSSLFAYCTEHLYYSESAAARRVQAARCLRRFPRVGVMLQGGEINLMTLGLVANLLTETNVDPWLERIRGKTQREVEAIAATVRPPLTLRDRARLVHVAMPVVSPLPLAPTSRTSVAMTAASTDGSTPATSLFASRSDAPSPDAASTESGDASGSGAATDANATPVPDGLVNSFANSQAGGKGSSTPVLTQPKVYIQFLADQSFMAKYRVATSILSNKLPKLTFEAVFVALIEDFIRRNEPIERHTRRERNATREHATDRTPLPVRTRDAVFMRDRGRCTFVGSDGKRCDATLRLHVDHIKPVALGGTNDMTNLRLLCARHNQLQAERLLGRGVMDSHRKREGVDAR